MCMVWALHLLVVKLWHVSGLGITGTSSVNYTIKRQRYDENSAAMKGAEHRDDSIVYPSAKRMQFQECTLPQGNRLGRLPNPIGTFEFN